MLAHTYDPSTWEAETRDQEFVTSVGYIGNILPQEKTKQ